MYVQFESVKMSFIEVSVLLIVVGKGSTIAAQSDKIGATKRNTDDGSGTKTAGCSLKQYLTEPSWQEALATEFEQSYFMKIEGLLEKDYNGGKEIFPPKDLIFNAFNLKPLDEVSRRPPKILFYCTKKNLFTVHKNLSVNFD